MTDLLDKEINVEEIMERIREEVRRRKGTFQTETSQKNGELFSTPQPVQLPQPMPESPLPIQKNSAKNSFDHFLWIYGRKYKTIIKKVPILSLIARKQHQRLLSQFISTPSVPPASYSKPVNFDVLPYYINYHGFLEQAKREEGVKGWFKFHLFKSIRYFGWWQEQINRALYQELLDQKARLDERERYIRTLHQQEIGQFTEELNKRDAMLDELKHHLISLTQSKDDIYRNLENHRMKIEESNRHFHETQFQHFSELKEILGERVEWFETKLSLLNQKNNTIGQELTDQKNKIEEVRQWLTLQLNSNIEEIRHEIDKQNKMYKDVLDRLFHFQQTGKTINHKLNLQEKRFNELEKNMQQLFDKGPEAIRSELERKEIVLKEKIESLNYQLSDMETLKVNLYPIFYEMLKGEERLPDALYVEFENQFRGKREEIKERLSIYVPHLRKASKRTGTLLVLDLGCGRGELVELLKENGFLAMGVDSNSLMIRHCQELGLDVTEQDVVNYLKNQPTNLFSAITGVHLLEHLSFKEICSVLKEAYRVLVPGGIAIFETPNPENMIVATNHFHLDPTHRHLLPPNLLSFLIHSVGFNRSEVIRLHPYNFLKKEETDVPGVKSILTLFNQAQDYSVICYKE